MGRHKTISDEQVLGVARDVFRRLGHTATTRAIAEAAGISEAVLYQRYGTKDDLFFAAMHPRGPDLLKLLGPPDPPDDAHAYLRAVIVRLGRYFADVIPLAMHVMTHPSFDPASLARTAPHAAVVLQQALGERLQALSRRQRIAATSPTVTAKLLVSLAHDWALGNVLAHGTATSRAAELKAMVDVVWDGLDVSGLT